MKLQCSKNGSNFVCEKGTFLQIRSHMRMNKPGLENVSAGWTVQTRVS